jgi:hypothetical protein
MYSSLKKGKPQSVKRRKKTLLVEILTEKNSSDPSGQTRNSARKLIKRLSSVARARSKTLTSAPTLPIVQASKRKAHALQAVATLRLNNDALALLREIDQAKAMLAIKRDFDLLEQTKKSLSVKTDIDSFLDIHRKVKKSVEPQDELRKVNEFKYAVEKANQFQRYKEHLSSLEQAKQALSMKDIVNNTYFHKSSRGVLLDWKRRLSHFESFKLDLKQALAYKVNFGNVSSYQVEFEKIKAFRKTFDSMQQFDRYVEKASAFQKEIDRAAELKKGIDSQAKLVEDLKRHIFLKMKEQNYRASLKLEGLTPNSDVGLSTLESIRAKYAG